MLPETVHLGDELARSFRRLGAALQSRRLAAALSAGSGTTLTPTKLRALDEIAEQAGIRVGVLAERIGIDETTATRLVDRLGTAGLVTRRSAVDDRRATLVVLTARGRKLMAAVAGRRREFYADVLESLEPAERDELVRLTAKAAAAVRLRSEELAAR
jgi:DNA-binding MarR family transcriptional regulator